MRRSERFACIGEVRHLGAMCAIELVTDREARTPAPDLTALTAQRALANGLVILPCGVYGNVLRVLVPLTASDDVVDEGLAILEKSLGEAVDES